MASSKSQEVALFGDKTAPAPSFASEDKGLGNENVSGSALATPQIKLIQALSPELREPDLKEKGIEVGKLYDNVSRAVYDSIICVNLYLETYYTVWRDRKKGGGKFGEFASEAEALSHINTMDNPDDYVAQETHKHWLMQLDPETADVVGGAVIYMKNTQLSPSRAWNTEIIKHDAPRFASVWQLSSVLQRNNRNDEYANYQFSFLGWVTQDLYEKLKPLYHSVASQAAGTSSSEQESASTEGQEEAA